MSHSTAKRISNYISESMSMWCLSEQVSLSRVSQPCDIACYDISQTYLKLMSDFVSELISECMMSDLESNIYVRMISVCVSTTSLRFFAFRTITTVPIVVGTTLGECVQVHTNFLYSHSQRWIVSIDSSTFNFKWWAAARTRTCFNCCCIDGCSGTDQLDWLFVQIRWQPIQMLVVYICTQKCLLTSLGIHCFLQSFHPGFVHSRVSFVNKSSVDE